MRSTRERNRKFAAELAYGGITAVWLNFSLNQLRQMWSSRTGDSHNARNDKGCKVVQLQLWKELVFAFVAIYSQPPSSGAQFLFVFVLFLPP